jgi:hypothetical protein
MRGDRCGTIEVLPRRTWREGGKSWRKRSYDNRGVPAEVQIVYPYNICLWRYLYTDLLCACDSETVVISYLWRYIGLQLTAVPKSVTDVRTVVFGYLRAADDAVNIT